MTLEKITFLLKNPDAVSKKSLFEELKKARFSIEEDGVLTEYFVLGEGEISYTPNTLYIADCTEGLLYLKEKGFPSAGWRHGYGEEEPLGKVRYILEDLPEIDIDDFEKVYQRETGLPWQILETEHLSLREFTCSDKDLAALYHIYDDRDAARFLAPLLSDKEKEREYLRSYIQNVYGFYGFGSWAVVLKETGEVIGRAGFSLPDPKSPDTPLGAFIPSLGYIIACKYRGRGYASEIMKPILDYGFHVLGFDAVTAEASGENIPSVKLLLSLGFKESEKQQGKVPADTIRFCLYKNTTALQ